MAGARWFNKNDDKHLIELHGRGLTDDAIGDQMDRGAQCIVTHRKALGLKANASITRQKRIERMLEFRNDPEFTHKRQAALARPDVIARQREASAEYQRSLAEQRENYKTQVPAGDPLLQALWRVHGSEIQARREREARA